MKLLGFFLGAALLTVAACGGKVDDGTGTADDDAGPLGRNPNGTNDGGNSYVDPQCPNKAPPLVYNECVVATQQGCGPGEGCYPAVIPPSARCEPETYASLCMPVGNGTQGTACGGHNACAAGYVCLITGGDTQCARMCDIKTKNACANGFVCEPIDVPGYAACL